MVAEAATHLRDSGEHPLRVFGRPAAYAAAVVDSVGRVPRRGGRVLLEAVGITKKYGKRVVLSDVDLTVRSGQIAAVVGANGCGKSTFLRLCAGMAGADGGEVRVHGSLGYCPQAGGTADFLTPDEHFVLIGAGRGLTRGGGALVRPVAGGGAGLACRAGAGAAPVRRDAAEAEPGAGRAGRSGRAAAGRAVPGVRPRDLPRLLGAGVAVA
ncbi:ABC transporter-like protein [Amycolatopsis methanolica 239]|uniref:ABC transporter-like protein n=1 Tax=Amycolatopsis methanolica 239 TaxID=1068978 RepID=A0A076MT05_AMYME|nr:ABC transporter-like protein [Amycolatopsis methanolica 239]